MFRVIWAMEKTRELVASKSSVSAQKIVHRTELATWKEINASTLVTQSQFHVGREFAKFLIMNQFATATKATF